LKHSKASSHRLFSRSKFPFSWSQPVFCGSMAMTLS